MKRKAFSLFMVLAMIVGLFSGLTMTASATDTWNGTASTIWTSGSGTADSPYQIATAANLKYLAEQVNGSTSEHYSGVYFELTDDINLANNAWTPIGGRWAGNSGTPGNSKYFSGIFNGKSHTISGLNVTDTTCGVGLFGYVNGGIIGNLTVTGTVNVTGSHAAIGGLVGYTNGSLVNCTSNVAVTATDSSNVGGLAGIVENTITTAVTHKTVGEETTTEEIPDKNTVIVDHCTSTKNVSANKRMGGLIGGAYAQVTGRVLVDGCSVLDGDSDTGDNDVYASSTAYKTFVGGLIGYCEASVSNCVVGENVRVSANGDDGHRMGGIAGILSGYGSAKGRLAECLFLGTIHNYSSNSSYDGAICVPESGTYMKNCFWIETAGEDTGVTLNQNISYDATNVMSLTENQLKCLASITSLVDGTHNIDYFLMQAPYWNSSFVNEWSCTSGVYPTLKAITAPTTAALGEYGVGSTFTGSDSGYGTSVVYYDSTAATSGSGTEAAPYNSFATAAAAMTGKTYLIVKSAVSVSDYDTYKTQLSGKTIVRSYTYSAPIFTVGSGQTLNLTGITIDGNDSARGNETMILIQGGTVTVDANSTLQKNHTISRDSAVRVDSGSLKVNGTVTGNVSALGGAIYVEDGAVFELGTGSGVDSSNSEKLQIIYLNNNGSSAPNISLKSALSSNLYIMCADDSVGTYVASGTSTILSTTTIGFFKYYGTTHTFARTSGTSPLYVYIAS